MAEEEFVAASPTPSDLKRKHEDLEQDAPEPPPTNANGADSVQREEEGVKEQNGGAADLDEADAKRPRLDENPDGFAMAENGFEEEKADDGGLPSAENYIKSVDAKEPTDEALDTENDKQSSPEDQLKEETQPTSVGYISLESHQQQPSGGEEYQEPLAEVPQAAVVYSEEQEPAAETETETVSRKMEVPNNKVGVLIGKQGETIRFLQINSGAKIQITRDAEADLNSTTRPAELIGTLENINKAERLIKDVIAEADAGGSPSLVARGFSNVQVTGAAEQILIQVPNEKVGLIIGKSGETIKNLQTRSGARIQLTPQHLPDGDQSKERTVRVSGDKKQIEMAREMIKEVMDQTVRSSSLSGGYNQQQQQGFRPRGPAQHQWGHHRGPHPSQSGGHNYQHRGSYPPSLNAQYAPPQNYPPHPMGPSRSGSFGSGWEQRHPPSTMLQGGGGYDYYGGHMGDVPASSHGHGPSATPMGPPPPAQGNYNYNYGQPQPAAPPYSSHAPQGYGHGHGFNEPKYDNQAPYHPSYGGGGSQPGPVGAGYPHPGYAPQDQQYGKAPPSYAQQQHYGGPPRGTPPGDAVPFQTGPMSVQPTPQQYLQNAAPPSQSQPTYPQAYPQPYGSDGYNINQQQQLQPVATGSAVPVYPQQGPVPGYGQQQQAFTGYAQAGPTGGYGSYPTGYSEQPAAQNTAATAAYGSYQGSVDPAAAYASVPPPAGQAVYAQPAPAQPSTGYDHSGSYGTAPATYGKSLSPQPGGYPQYDATGQVIGGPR